MTVFRDLLAFLDHFLNLVFEKQPTFQKIERIKFVFENLLHFFFSRWSLYFKYQFLTAKKSTFFFISYRTLHLNRYITFLDGLSWGTVTFSVTELDFLSKFDNKFDLLLPSFEQNSCPLRSLGLLVWKLYWLHTRNVQKS